MSLHFNEKTLIIRGWRVGFQKIEFTKMLQRELGFGLLEAKNITDRVLTNELIEVPIGEANLENLRAAAVQLGAVVVVEELESVCQ